MNYSHALAQVGLSPTESNVYLFLVQNGQCSAPQIQAGLNIEKVPVYRALDALKKRVYVQAMGESRNQLFVATPLQTVLTDYDERIKSIANARSDIETLVRDLADKQASLYKDHRITVYEGLDGYRLWVESRLQGDVDIIREFGQNSFVEQFFASSQDFDDYMHGYIARRVAKGIRMRSLGDAVRLRDYDATSAAILKEQRHLDMGGDQAALFSVFGDRFGYYSKQGDRYVGVIIQDPMLVRLLTLLFDALWNQAKESTSD